MAFPTWACPAAQFRPCRVCGLTWGRLAGASRRGHRVASAALVPRPAGVSLGSQKIRGPRTNRVMAIGDDAGRQLRGADIRQLIFQAMHQSDDLVVTFDYCDAKGGPLAEWSAPFDSWARTASGPVPQPRRTPTVLPGSRQNVRLAPAADFLMPVAMVG